MGQGVVHVFRTHQVKGGVPDNILLGEEIGQELDRRQDERTGERGGCGMIITGQWYMI